MNSKSSQVLFQYWNEVRGLRMAPRRFDIEPTHLGGTLPDTFILECEDDGGCTFRLAGTNICELFDREFRGSDFFDLLNASEDQLVRQLLQSVIHQGAVLVLTLETQFGDTPVRLEAVLLPLVHTNNTISRILGALSVDGQMPIAAPAATLPVRLTGHQIVWPDGRPFNVLQKLHRQSPFAPESRLARIVSSDRRRFRVFEGGRGNSD